MRTNTIRNNNYVNYIQTNFKIYAIYLTRLKYFLPLNLYEFKLLKWITKNVTMIQNEYNIFSYILNWNLFLPCFILRIRKIWSLLKTFLNILFNS